MVCVFSDGRDIMDGHKCRVFALMYHPTIPHVFISGGWDDTVQVTPYTRNCNSSFHYTTFPFNFITDLAFTI